jgi:uncharacterized membrane protein (UPF0127 family)
MAKFNFHYKNKRFYIDVIECKTILQKATGLMFKKKSKALLFFFNKPVNESIHSFFCIPFIAIWFNSDKIVDVKHISSWKINIKPSEKFDRLLEVPCNDDNFKFILDSYRKV